MGEKKEVYRFIKLTDNINTATLGVADQLRLLFSKVSNSEEAELDARKKLNADAMRKIAALNGLLDTAIERMNKKGENQVVLGVSSEFLPYIDSVIDPVHGKGRYYEFIVKKKDLPMTVRHLFTVIIRKKLT